MSTLILRDSVSAEASRFVNLVATLGLKCQQTELKTKPGAFHWHIQRPNEPGTLEATIIPGREFIELVVRSNRKGAWVKSALEFLISNW